MQRAIDYLEGELDSLQDAYETTEGDTKDQYGIWEEEVRNAIECLKKANGKQSTKVSDNHDSKSLSIADVMARFHISKAIKFRLKNGKYTDAKGNEITVEMIMKNKHEIYEDNGVLWLD